MKYTRLQMLISAALIVSGLSSLIVWFLNVALGISAGIPVSWMWLAMESFFQKGFVTAVFLTAVIHAMLFMVVNGHYLMPIVTSSKLAISRMIFFISFFLSLFYYIFNFQLALQYHEKGELVFFVAASVISYVFCFVLLFKRACPTDRNLLLINGLVFFSVSVFFFPWLGALV